MFWGCFYRRWQAPPLDKVAILLRRKYIHQSAGRNMTKLLEKALEEVSRLPDRDQKE